MSSKWSLSKYKYIQYLTCNDVGDIGETIFKELMLHYYEDKDIVKNTEKSQKCYDFLVKDYKFEIKTSRQDYKLIFQHENLRQNKADFYTFIDISPNKIYFTILKNFDMDKKHPILNIKAHNRHGSNSYKMNFSRKTISKLLKVEKCLEIDETTTYEDIKEFIGKNTK